MSCSLKFVINKIKLNYKNTLRDHKIRIIFSAVNYVTNYCTNKINDELYHYVVILNL